MVKRFLRLVNTRQSPIRFRLEPWGDEVTMNAGATFVVRAEGPSIGDLEIAMSDDAVAVWGWVGSTVSVSEDNRIVAQGHTPVPAVPSRRTVRSFVEGLGGP